MTRLETLYNMIKYIMFANSKLLLEVKLESRYLCPVYFMPILKGQIVNAAYHFFVSFPNIFQFPSLCI